MPLPAHYAGNVENRGEMFLVRIAETPLKSRWGGVNKGAYLKRSGHGDY